jgi:hypothetical protein
MQPSRLLAWALAVVAGVVLSGGARAESPGTVGGAFQIARAVVAPELQTQVVSVYGIGSPAVIEKWYIIFYDPAVPSHGRAVLVEDGQVTKTYPANGGVIYSADLTFDPSRISSEVPALGAVQTYAARHHLPYDSVRTLLKQTSVNKPFRWRIELLDGGISRGYVYVNALDDSVASYEPGPSSGKPPPPDNSVGGFGNDVKKTFLGIGGDLQQFFTGQRTVDR